MELTVCINVTLCLVVSLKCMELTVYNGHFCLPR